MSETAVASPAGALPRGSVGSVIHNTWAIAKREFRSYFSSALGYIVIGMFLLLVGVLFFFVFNFLERNEVTLQYLFESVAWLSWAIAPAIAMRTFAEESRTGTIEMLITQPVRDWEVILGKYLGAVGLFAVALLATFVYPMAVSKMGELDWGPVLGGYLGLLLGGAAYVSFGVMVSSYTKDQITAFFVAFVVGLLFFVLNYIGPALGSAATFIVYLSPRYHFDSIARGVVDIRNIIYFLSVISVCLLATARSLDSRRWS